MRSYNGLLMFSSSGDVRGRCVMNWFFSDNFFDWSGSVVGRGSMVNWSSSVMNRRSLVNWGGVMDWSVVVHWSSMMHRLWLFMILLFEGHCV